MMNAWILGARPKTLTAAFVPVWVGSALVLRTAVSEFRWELSALALASAFLIQIGTNFFNDAIDFRKGADAQNRVGPSRMAQEGMLSVAAVERGALVAFGLASVLALPLIWAGGPTILWIGLASLIAGYCYTGGPFPLAYRGLGDLFVLIFFGWVAVGGIYFLHTRTFPMAAIMAGTQVGLLAVTLIAINNFRDATGDRVVGKNTLAVRFGARFARLEIVACAVLPLALGAFWVFHEKPAAFLVPLLIAPMAGALARDAWRIEPGPECNELLARAAKLHLAFGVLLGIGLGF